MKRLAAVLSVALAAAPASAEQLTVSTSYPSPVGVYKYLVTTGGTAGDPANTVLARTAGSVGIGVAAPGAATKLQVAGRGLFTGGTHDPADGTPPGVSISFESGVGVIRAVQTAVASYNLSLQPTAGNVGIGMSAPTNRLEVQANGQYSAGMFSNPTGHGLYGISYNGSSIGYHGVYGETRDPAGGGMVGVSNLPGVGYAYAYIGHNGYWSVIANSYATFAGVTYGSDRRLKENIEPLRDPLSKILALRPVSFNWRKDSEQYASHKGMDVGLIGQEVEKVLPELVTDIQAPKPPMPAPETLNQKLGTYKTVEYVRVVPYLAGAVQQLHAENQKLKAELVEVQERLRRLEDAKTAAR